MAHCREKKWQLAGIRNGTRAWSCCCPKRKRPPYQGCSHRCWFFFPKITAPSKLSEACNFWQTCTILDFNKPVFLRHCSCSLGCSPISKIPGNSSHIDARNEKADIQAVYNKCCSSLQPKWQWTLQFKRLIQKVGIKQTPLHLGEHSLDISNGCPYSVAICRLAIWLHFRQQHCTVATVIMQGVFTQASKALRQLVCLQEQGKWSLKGSLKVMKLLTISPFGTWKLWGLRGKANIQLPITGWEEKCFRGIPVCYRKWPCAIQQ